LCGSRRPWAASPDGDPHPGGLWYVYEYDADLLDLLGCLGIHLQVTVYPTALPNDT